LQFADTAMIFNTCILLVLLFFRTTISIDVYDAPTNSSGFLIPDVKTTSYPSYIEAVPAPTTTPCASGDMPSKCLIRKDRDDKIHAEWAKKDDEYKKIYEQQKKKYEEIQAKETKEYLEAIDKANEELKQQFLEDAARKAADTYFKPLGYNASYPTFYVGVRRLFWELKNQFGDRGSDEAQMLSEFFRKYGYIVAGIDFPSNSTSTEVTSTAPTSAVSPENSTSIPEVITSPEPTNGSIVWNVKTYLLESKYGVPALIIIIVFFTLISILFLVSICLICMLFVWVAKKVCSKKRKSKNANVDKLDPKKREPPIIVTTPLSTDETVSPRGSPRASPSSKKHKSIKKAELIKTKKSASVEDPVSSKKVVPKKDVVPKKNNDVMPKKNSEVMPTKSSVTNLNSPPHSITARDHSIKATDHSIINMPDSEFALTWTSNKQPGPKQSVQENNVGQQSGMKASQSDQFSQPSLYVEQSKTDDPSTLNSHK